MDTPTHRCAECGTAVIILEGEIIRACPHEEAAVIAEMEAVAYGVGSMEQTS
jgi:hypothetical protein